MQRYKNKMDIEVQMYRKLVDFQKVPNLSNLKVHLQESERPWIAKYHVVIYLSEKPLWANCWLIDILKFSWL